MQDDSPGTRNAGVVADGWLGLAVFAADIDCGGFAK